jgi:hypothetical protein
MCGSVILRQGGIMRRLNIDVCVSREGLIVMGDVLGGMRSIDRVEWHRTARQLVDQGLLRPLGGCVLLPAYRGWTGCVGGFGAVDENQNRN